MNINMNQTLVVVFVKVQIEDQLSGFMLLHCAIWSCPDVFRAYFCL